MSHLSSPALRAPAGRLAIAHAAAAAAARQRAADPRLERFGTAALFSTRDRNISGLYELIT